MAKAEVAKGGDRVTAGGRTGVVVSSSTYDALWPENTARSRKSRAVNQDANEIILTVQLDGEARPRNFRAADVKKE